MADAFDAMWDDRMDEEELEDVDEFAQVDPLDELNRWDQDKFFRILDLLPREQLEPAMDHFMSHPTKIRAVVDYAKQQKELLENKDVDALKELFERERIVIEKLNQEAVAEEA